MDLTKDSLSSWRYEATARIQPVLLVMSPLLVFMAVFGGPTVVSLTETGGLVGLIALVLTLTGAQWAREQGRVAEQVLWKSWGGPPTTRFLRWSNRELPALERDTARSRLAAMYPDLPWPTAEAETASPSKADEVYTEAIRRLREHTRDPAKFGLLDKENSRYGYQRNLYGLRSVAVAVAIATASLSLWMMSPGIVFPSSATTLDPQYACYLLPALVAVLVLYVTAPTRLSASVKSAADRYARQLLVSAERLPDKTAAEARTASRT